MDWEELKEGTPNFPNFSQSKSALNISIKTSWFKWNEWDSIYKHFDQESECPKWLSGEVEKLEISDSDVRFK